MKQKPIPFLSPKKSVKPKLVPKPKLLIVTALTAILVVGASWLLLDLFSKKDSLSAAEIEARNAAFREHRAFTLTPVKPDPKGRKEALQSMALRAPEEEALIKDVESGKQNLFWLYVFDDVEEDGDIVMISSRGFSLQVPIFHAPKAVAVPLMPGESQVTIIGVRDGGGGITVAVRSNGVAVPLPRLLPGESVLIPVSRGVLP